jgi:hypothetical protein
MDTVVRDKARTSLPKTHKGRMFRKRPRLKPEGITGIWDQDLKEQLYLGSEWQDLQECCNAGDREMKNQAFSDDSKNE